MGENNTFSSNPSSLFKKKSKTADVPATAQKAEGYLRKTLEDNPILARFKQYNEGFAFCRYRMRPDFDRRGGTSPWGEEEFCCSWRGLHFLVQGLSVFHHLARRFASLVEGIWTLSNVQGRGDFFFGGGGQVKKSC